MTVRLKLMIVDSSALHKHTAEGANREGHKGIAARRIIEREGTNRKAGDLRNVGIDRLEGGGVVSLSGELTVS